VVCQWCNARIGPEEVGRPCSRGDKLRAANKGSDVNAVLIAMVAASMSTHRPDNRHAPIADPCPCGREAADHRVSHAAKGDPCSACRLPASSHLKVRGALDRKKVIAALRARDGWACQICGAALDDPSPAYPHPMSAQIDHLEPAWKGGGEDLANLRLAHRVCNMRRGGVETSPAQAERDERARRHHAKKE
jgi:hypothetical protein